MDVFSCFDASLKALATLGDNLILHALCAEIYEAPHGFPVPFAMDQPFIDSRNSTIFASRAAIWSPISFISLKSSCCIESL